MSRSDARAALVGAAVGAVCGVAWLPGELLDALAADSGLPGRAEALASFATSAGLDLAFVDASASEAPEMVAALQAADIAAVWAVDGVLGRIARDIGWAEALRATAAAPAVLTRRIDEMLHEALISARAGCAAGADALLLADDLAGPAGPLLAPDYVLDALLPAYHRFAVEGTEAGLPMVFHSDGDIEAFLPALARAGFTAVHLASAKPDGFAEQATASRRTGLVVLGGIAARELPEAAREAGRRAGALAASLRSTVVCDDGGISAYEELAALTEAIRSARDAYGDASG